MANFRNIKYQTTINVFRNTPICIVSILFNWIQDTICTKPSLAQLYFLKMAKKYKIYVCAIMYTFNKITHIMRQKGILNCKISERHSTFRVSMCIFTNLKNVNLIISLNQINTNQQSSISFFSEYLSNHNSQIHTTTPKSSSFITTPCKSPICPVLPFFPHFVLVQTQAC